MLIHETVARLRREFVLEVDLTVRGPVPLNQFFAELAVTHVALPELNCGRVAEYLQGMRYPVDTIGEPSEKLAGFLFFAGQEGLAFVNADDILEKISAMPVLTWNYKTQDAAIRHIGPMAQDFKAAFGVGESETGITTIDADGVALAAIQALAADGRNQKAEIESMRKENAALKSELDALKARLDAMSPPR